MNLDNLKSDWQKSESVSGSSSDRDMDSIERNLKALDKDIQKRTVYGILTFLIVAVSALAFAYFLYVLNMPTLAIAGLLSWVFCIAIAIVRLFLLRTNTLELSKSVNVEVYLKSKHQRVDMEISFYQSFVLWILAPMSASIVMILIAVEANLLTATLQLGLFMLILFFAHRHNKNLISKNLLPIKEKLSIAIASL